MLIAELSLTTISFSSVLGVVFGCLALFLVALALWVRRTGKNLPKAEARSWLTWLVFPVYWAIVAVLALSSFAAILVDGHMLGYPLLMHLAGAGAFVFILVLVAMLAMFYGKPEVQARSSNRWWFTRWNAGLMVVSGILTAGTMFLSMLPILGTEGLLQAVALHRYAGLAVVVFCVCHIAGILCTRAGLR